MKAGEYRFNWRGDIIRVIVVGDVLALPDEKWSMGGFGSRISREWLLYEAKLPGTKAFKGVLAECLVRALDQHHGVPAGAMALHDGRPPRCHPTGPSVPCHACMGSGFIPADGAL